MYDESIETGPLGVTWQGPTEALAAEKERIEKSRRLCSGFPKLEGMIKLSTHKYLILAARPGLYKSTLGFNMAWNLATAGHSVLWVSLEMSPGQMATMALSRLSAIPRDDVDTCLAAKAVPLNYRDQWRVGVERLAKVRSLRWHERDSSLSGVLDSMARAPYECVFVDYVQLVQSGAAKDYENVTAVSKALAWHAHNRGSLVVALSQLNREIDRVQGTGTSIRYPRLSDLKGSSQLEQDADVVMFLHRSSTDPEADRTKVDVVVEKNRYGRAGIVRLRARPEIGLIEEENENED